MIKNLKYLLLFILFIFINNSLGYSQVQNHDTTTFDNRKFNQEKLTQYRENDRYDYETHDDIIQRFFEWILKILRDAFDLDLPDAQITETAGNGISILLLLIAIAILIVLISNTKFRAWFTGKGTKVKTDYTVEEEDIHDINFDIEILDAEKQGNFRRAIRLLFLKVLKKLDDAEKIIWDPYKTNYEYKYELTGTSLYQDFARCMRTYEDVWYGEKSINIHDYTISKIEFEKFNNLTSKTKITTVFNE